MYPSTLALMTKASANKKAFTPPVSAVMERYFAKYRTLDAEDGSPDEGESVTPVPIGCALSNETASPSTAGSSSDAL